MAGPDAGSAAAGTFGQRVLLPALADAERLTASLSEGMLTVMAPQSGTSKPHRAEVTSG